MTSLNLDHVSSITHAERYIQIAIVPNMSPRHRQELEDDLVRLTDVKKHILEYLYEPCLPVDSESLKKPVDHGDTDS